MTEPDLSIFVDTNCFLQLRDLKDLPWEDLFPGPAWIEILVAPIIVDELDQKKNDRNNPRLRERSRVALALLEQSTISDDLRVELKTKSPRLTLRAVNPIAPNWAAHPTLDPRRNDDQLVMAALTHPQPRVLLSNDSGPLIRSRLHNLEAIKSPKDWHLPDQADDATKEITRLKRELAEEQAKKPQLAIDVMADGSPTKKLQLVLPELEPLSPSQVRALTDAHLYRNPKVNLRLPEGPEAYAVLMAVRLGYTSAEVAAYNGKYDEYEERVREYFLRLHKIVSLNAKVLRPGVRVSNSSPHTAQKVLLTLTVSAGLRLITDSEWPPHGERLSLPEPPDTKKGGGIMASLIPALRPSDAPTDPTFFYWQDRPQREEWRSSCSRLCQEVRARTEVAANFTVFVAQREGRHVLSLTATATNLGSPIKEDFVIDVSSSQMGWSDPAVLNSLDRSIADDILHYVKR